MAEEVLAQLPPFVAEPHGAEGHPAPPREPWGGAQKRQRVQEPVRRQDDWREGGPGREELLPGPRREQ